MPNFNSNLLLNNENLGCILDAINALPDEEDSKEEGYTEGFEVGYTEGEAVGYSKGYNKGVEDTTPRGEIEITENGTHNVTPYASATVNVVDDRLRGMIENNIVDMVVPYGFTTIGYAAFYSQQKMLSIAIPDTVTAVGSYAFYYCIALRELNLPDTVTSIGNSAFYALFEITEITLPANLETVGSQAFGVGRKLKKVTFKSTPTVAANAFNDCAVLTDIYVPWAEGAVANAPWGATNATIHYNSEV